jgi:hypothetical protein
MPSKKYLYCTAAVSGLVLAVVIATASLNGASLQDTLAHIFLLVLYGFLIAAYLSRLVLVTFGVLAVYKIFQERHRQVHG